MMERKGQAYGHRLGVTRTADVRAAKVVQLWNLGTRTTDIAKHVGVSALTIKADLEMLAAEGRIKRRVGRPPKVIEVAEDQPPHADDR